MAAKKLKKKELSRGLQRRLERRKPGERWIMIFHEHHGDRYFAADTAEQICGACLKWLTDMYGEHKPGYYKASERLRDAEEDLKNLEAGKGKNYEPKKPLTPKGDVDKLPEDLQEAVREQWKKFDAQLVASEGEVAEWAAVKKVIAEKDLVGAYEIKMGEFGGDEQEMDFWPLEIG